jgi:polar amino acid transport system substrate-binding protein
MKKIFVKFCAALMLVSSLAMLASCGKGKKADNSLEEIKSRGILIMGLDDSFPPLGFRDENNKIVGYDVDLATEVANRLGVNLKLQPIDWAAKEQELNTKKIDCIWSGFTMTEERKAAMAFTKPYLDNAQVAVVQSESGINSLADLAGKTVGVQAGSSAWDAVNADEKFAGSLKETVEFEENITALNDLGIGNLDAVVMDQVVAGYMIKNSSQSYKILPDGLAGEEYGVAFRKDDLKLRNEVQKILEQMQADGTVKGISEKWFGEDLSVIGR